MSSSASSDQQQQQGGSHLPPDHNRIRLAVYNVHKEIRIYHGAVFVHGREFHYGPNDGMFEKEARNGGKPLHSRRLRVLRWRMKFMCDVDLAWKNQPLYTKLSLEGVRAAAEILRVRYSIAHYNLITRNCLDYVLDLIRLISAVPLPRGDFFGWCQEIRQPMIAMPLRLAWQGFRKIAAKGRETEKNQTAMRDQEYRDAETQTVSREREEEMQKIDMVDEKEVDKLSQDSGNCSEDSIDCADSIPNFYQQLFITTINVQAEENVTI